MYTTERGKNVLLKSGVIQKYTDESKVDEENNRKTCENNNIVNCIWDSPFYNH